MEDADRPEESIPAEPGNEARHVRLAVALALALLFVAAGLLALFVSLSRKPSSPALSRSAAAWVAAPPAPAAPAAPTKAQPDAGVRDAGARQPDKDAVARTAPDAGTTAPSGIVRKGKVSSSAPVISSLTRLGLTMTDAHAIITALDGIFDFRRARPGQTFEVHMDPATRKPVYFRYDESLVGVYEVRRHGDELVGAKKRIPTQKRIMRFGGTIASSLYKALAGMDAHPALTGLIMEVLSTQVDFYKEQRPGDTFRAIVEEESLDGQFLGYGPVLALEYNGVHSGKKRFFYFEAGDDATYYNEQGISAPRSVISIPLHYTRISSTFGMRFHPILKQKKMHAGVDFAAGGGAPVWACQKGRVVSADRRGANGNLVVIAHEDGLVSYYAHLSRFTAGIRPGVELRERQVLGYVGSTGRSTGPHLHFGLKKNGRFIDPLSYKIRPGAPVAARWKAELRTIIARMSEMLDRTPVRPPDEPFARIKDDSAEVLGVEEIE
ncbi:MAG: peptidoglycan DD-metalloendopeptidase family protein [Deltaproteobacteria bacterium]|nr:peptidoglycan DD-metalloendopeptidase family protein [Deltaproteobacteria bacterium]